MRNTLWRPLLPLMAWIILMPLTTPGAAAEEPSAGVILLHGKLGSPSKNIASLARKLESEGFLVERPDMAWSGTRKYEKSYDDSVNEISKIITKLRSRGADIIIVGGHSLGANAAIRYGATHTDIDGILAIAPGHVPEVKGYQKRVAKSVKHARKLVSAGKGDKRGSFTDVNQGKKYSINVPAEVYLSYFSPNGPAVMPKNIRSISAPILWVIGKGDRMNKRGKKYAFNKTPDHPMNRYLVVSGGHGDTPDRARNEITAWIKDLMEK